MLARPEILSSEILVLEVASDALGASVEASFHGAGATTVILDVSSVTQAALVGSGATAVEGRTQAVARTKLESAGAATVDARASGANQVVFSAHGVTAVDGQVGYARQGVFDGLGISYVDFYPLEEPGFDLVGVSTVQFFSSAVADLIWVIEGVAEADMAGQPLVHSQALAEGSAQFDAQISATNQAGFDGAGFDQTSFSGMAYRNVTAQGHGNSAVAGRAQTLIHAGYEGEGQAQVDFLVNPLLKTNLVFEGAGSASVSFFTNPQFNINTQVHVQGVGLVDMGVLGVQWVETAVKGWSTAMFRRGREVQPYLDTSVYLAIRPEENRSADWR